MAVPGHRPEDDSMAPAENVAGYAAPGVPEQPALGKYVGTLGQDPEEVATQGCHERNLPWTQSRVRSLSKF